LVMKKTLSILIALCLAAALPVPWARSPEASAEAEDAGANDLSGDSIVSYLQKHADAPHPEEAIPVYTDHAQPRTLCEGETLELPLTVPRAGLYCVRLTYRTLPGLGVSPALQMRVNGEYPYTEARNVTLKRRYKEINIGRKDAQGNEIIPDSEEIDGFQTAVLSDMTGYWGDALSIYLCEGANALSLTMDSESIVISDLTLCNDPSPAGYAAYAAPYGPETDGAYIQYIEAERITAKSDVTIYPLNDRTSPSTSPYNSRQKNLNTIGAAKWNKAGQYLEWNMDVPADGLYRIALKYRQNINDGMSSYRRITIDGKIPFDELSSVAFPYDLNWQNLTLGGEEPYLFYLKQGPHTLRMEVVLGDLAAVLPRIQDSVVALNDAYRKIIMLMGPNPDRYRDYRLFEALPDVVETLGRQAAILDDIEKRLLAVTGKDSVGTKTISTLARQLHEFSGDTDSIQRRLSKFKDNISALSAWMTEAKSMPLELDYLVLYQGGASLKDADAGFFGKLMHEINTLLYTFTGDYQKRAAGDAVNVWVQAGRDQAEVISELAVNDFTPKTGIDVNIKLIQSSSGTVQNQLLMAVVAGRGPDAALQVSPTDAMNYAFRGALCDLNVYDADGTVKSRFRESALIPLTFEGRLYGLPETQTFPMLFYRSDVLKELRADLPETWEQMTALTAKLQKKNLEFGVPSGFFNTLLYQYGGSLYKEDASATTLTERPAVAAFTFWTDLYTRYGLPVSYDAMNRFRSGEMPLVVADFTLYNQLAIGAPEIAGLWGIAPIPGVKREDGSVSRAAAAGGVCSILLAGEDEGRRDNAWTFLEWWSSDAIQQKYGSQMEIVLGPSGRYPAANIRAFQAMAWPRRDMEKLMEQSAFVQGVPEVPGGYFMTRHIENAFRSVINKGDVPGESLLHYAGIIDREITYKRQELKLDR